MSDETTKICGKCKKAKPMADFASKHAGKTRMYCEQCMEYGRKAMKAWRSRNPEKDRAIHDAYYEANKDKLKAYDATRREKRLKASKIWQAANLDKVYKNNAKWRAAQLRAMPSWLNAAHIAEIDGYYQYISIFTGFHVDHIVPLQGKNVCGLHVPWNLQILPAVENMRKGNRFKEVS